MFYITVPDKNDSVSRITISGKEYLIRFTYNPSYDYWSYGLYDIHKRPVLPMAKIVPFSPLLYFYRYTDLPEGQLCCFSTEEKVGRYAFKEGKARFAYIADSELKGVGAG